VRESSSTLRRGEIEAVSVHDPSLNGVGSHLLDGVLGAPRFDAPAQGLPGPPSHSSTD
jgi:hypothetical protein